MKFKKKILTIICSFLIIGSLFYAYKKHELTSYYKAQLRQANRLVLFDFENKQKSDVFIEDWNKIKEQMHQDGYSRAEIEKIDSKAFLQATKNVDNARSLKK